MAKRRKGFLVYLDYLDYFDFLSDEQLGMVFHGIFDYGKNAHSKPWFIPGYGPRSSSLGLSLGLSYTLPFNRASQSQQPTPQKQ